MGELFQQLLDWVAANPGWAYLTVFLVAFAESMAVVGLLVPGVVMMFGLGALVTAGALDFWPVLAWAVVGAVVGDGASFWLGYHYRERLMGMWPFNRYPDSLKAGVAFFEKYGGKSVAFGRFVGPVRAVIPLVAGMLGMTPLRFFIANLLSALAWAPAYLLPGMVFGASLELAAEVAFHLVVLLGAILALVWLVAWMVRGAFYLLSPHANAWLGSLLRWSELHPKLGEIAAALADPNHPDARGLAILATLLLLTGFASVTLVSITLSGDGLAGINRLVFDALQAIRTPFGDHLMVALRRFGDLGLLLGVGLLVVAYLWLVGHRRTALYWFAALAFGLGAPLILGSLLQIPHLEGRPGTAAGTGQVMRTSVLYGFLSVVIARGMLTHWRWLPYGIAGVLIALVGLAQLCLGAAGLTLVLGSLTLGLAWVAALGIAYRRHTHLESHWRDLTLVSLAAIGLVYGVQTYRLQDQEVAAARPDQPLRVSSTEAWRTQLWRELPAWRDDLRQQHNHPFNLQYAGDPAALAEMLAPAGWRPAPLLDWGNSLKLLSPDLPLQELPVLPQVHDGRHSAFAWVKPLAEGRRLVLRLWPSGYRLGDADKPLWIGSVSDQTKLTPLGLLAIPATSNRFTDAYRVLLQDLGTARPQQPDPGRSLLLVGP